MHSWILSIFIVRTRAQLIVQMLFIISSAQVHLLVQDVITELFLFRKEMARNRLCRMTDAELTEILDKGDPDVAEFVVTSDSDSVSVLESETRKKREFHVVEGLKRMVNRHIGVGKFRVKEKVSKSSKENENYQC